MGTRGNSQFLLIHRGHSWAVADLTQMPQTVSHSELVSQRMRRPVGTSVFEENSYCCRLEGIPILQVLEKDGCFGLHLLDSIVFPGGGGQAADAGFVRSRPSF